MSKKEKTELKQTASKFKFIGKVTRIDKDKAFVEDKSTKEGKNKGKVYRSLRFGVKTSNTNEMTVQMFDFEPEEVFLWNSDKKKKNPSYKGDRIPFAKWEKDQEKLRQQGYAVLQARVGLEFDDKGKVESQGLPSFVASELIYDGLDNGDTVLVEGDIRYSTYENQQGKMVEQKQYNIQKILRLKDIDFDSEKFEETSYFEQEFVFVDAVAEKKEKKVYVTGRTISYNKSWHDTQFVIDYSDGEGGTDKAMVTLADAFMKKIKFGDFLKVYGDTVNRVILAELDDESDSEEEDLLASLGGKKKPSHADYKVKNYITEAQIHGVEVWDKKVYKEEDFVKDELLDDSEDEKENDELSELGGKKKKVNDEENPFGDIDEDEIDISDEDLPF